VSVPIPEMRFCSEKKKSNFDSSKIVFISHDRFGLIIHCQTNKWSQTNLKLRNHYSVFT